MARLSDTPVIHPTARLTGCTLGRYVEVAEGCRLAETEIGDYSYLMENCQTWCVTIGRFATPRAAAVLFRHVDETPR